MDIQLIHWYDTKRLEEGVVYQMVESTAFFEAYRHVLEGLKEIDPTELPMEVTVYRPFSCFTSHMSAHNFRNFCMHQMHDTRNNGKKD